jgi:hypothetical protein
VLIDELCLVGAVWRGLAWANIDLGLLIGVALLIGKRRSTVLTWD